MNDITTFVEQFKEQFIDADEITIDPFTNFRQIESWDSLTGMSILVMIKDEFDVDITVEEFKNCSNVQEVYDLVQAKKS
ncbi:acyl carrier protein [Aridibaculum aurantiacum]|uniref:acyl carrier protein n=1 Tax=Aridibaculum aurantiacum TaxID=2810307 RepID=UPI001A95B4C8|nr:acyl carrier protein [Aridibaculum aurantiacum]